MDNTKFTKGKWKVFRKATENKEGFNKTRFQTSVINGIIKDSPICCIWGSNEEIANANALLISKAPEMLYLLNDLLHDKGISDVSRREIELLIKSATELK